MTDENVMTPGTVVGTRYEIRDLIGRGGFSITYRAVDKQLLDHPCVVKELVLSHHTNDKAMALFKREAQVLLKLDHKRVPKVHAYIEEHGHFFLVQDFVDGETLESKLDRDGRLPEARVRDIVTQLLEVLAYLHSHDPQVIHRDIKPANLIEKPDGSIVLIDFGAVREALSGADTAGQTAISSAGYSPIEQYMGRASPASDIYALGATALHLVSGAHPRDWHDPMTGGLTFAGKLPCSPQFAAVIERMVADLPQRFRSAQDVRAALQADESATIALRSGGSTRLGPTRDPTTIASSAPRTVVPPPPRRGLVERYWPRVVGAVVVVLVVAAVFKSDSKRTETTAAPPVAKTAEIRQQQAGVRVKTPNSTPAASSRPTQAAPPQNNARLTKASSPAQDESSASAGRSATAPLTTPVPAPAPVDISKPAAAAAPPVTAPDACAGIPRCFNAGHFSATLSYVAVSQINSFTAVARNVKLTIKLRNLTDQPLILAYRAGSGQLVDDEKNQYRNEIAGGESFVKGIGISSRFGANPEFVLDPRESREVILDNSVYLAKTVIYGVTYNYDLTIDELVVQGNQARPTRSSTVSFRDIKEPSRGADNSAPRELTRPQATVAGELDGGTNGPSAANGETVAAYDIDVAAETDSPSTAQDACGSTPNCYNAGRFIATVSRLWSRQIKGTSATAMNVKLTLRIRNVSDKQIALVYKAASGELTDDAGHRYFNDRTGGREYVSGIGMSDNAADPVFTLNPGEARAATFDNYHYAKTDEGPGAVYSYDLALQELESLPSGQTRVVRTAAVGFHDLKESTSASAQGLDTASYDTGRLVARLTRVSAVEKRLSSSTDRRVTIAMNITNQTDQPMILAYRAKSQQLSDDRGHSYKNDAVGAAFVTGIGLSTRDGIDPVFTLAPGESREASFQNLLYLALDDHSGARYDYDLVLDECERTPSKQVRVVRTNSVSFHDFRDTHRSRKQMLLDALKPTFKKSPL